LTQGVKLFFVRQLAVPEEVRDPCVSHDGNQVFDQVTAAIDETAIGAVDLADGGFSGHHTFQPRPEFRNFGVKFR
jgi:hypothetical protein